MKNIDIDQEKIVFEFLLSDKSQIKSILREKALEGAELEYIRSEEISLNEAEQIYGIGENNEEGNQKAGKKTIIKENSKRKLIKKIKKKAGKKTIKKKVIKAGKTILKKKTVKKKPGKKVLKKKMVKRLLGKN